MEIIEFDAIIIKRTCARCSYQWWPRAKETRRCPHCQTRLWRKTETEEAVETAIASDEMK